MTSRGNRKGAIKMIFWIVGIAVAVIAGTTYASRRGWIYSGFRKPKSSGSGALGELIDAFHPSHSHVAEELSRERPVFEESAPRRDSVGLDKIADTDAGNIGYLGLPNTRRSEEDT